MQDRQRVGNAILRHVCVTIIVAEKQSVIHNLSIDINIYILFTFHESTITTNRI